MSMQPRPWPLPADDVARAVQAMFAGRRAPLPVVVRDELGELFVDAEFAQAFGVRGRPGWSPGRLAMVTVLQMAENLTDAQAAQAVRVRLDWKYCLGLALTDAGFDASVLSEFRSRVLEHGLEQRVLDRLVAVLVERGLIKAGGRQRTDSSHVLAAVRELNRLELAGETVRGCVEAIAAVDPDWLAGVLDLPGWARRYGARVDSWRLPASKTKRDALAGDYGRDGFALLNAVYADTTPAWVRQLPAVETLRVVLVQQYTVDTDRGGREVIRRREASTDGLPPGRSKITSPWDLDARHGGKRDLNWTGYKIHISETCDAEAATGPGGETPAGAVLNLITHVATTDASVPDVAMTEAIHEGLARRQVLPAEHLLDSGYPSADLLISSTARFGVTLITPMLADTSAQARAAAGYDRTAFTIDWDRRQVTCPQQHTSICWAPATQRGTDVIITRFDRRTCQQCPVKPACTTATRTGRQLTLRPRPVQQALDQARAAQHTPDWQAKYAARAGAESTIAQAVKITDTRHARYRGLPKTRLEHIYTAVALNLIRLDAWLNGHPLQPRQTTHLTRLELTLAA